MMSAASYSGAVVPLLESALTHPTRASGLVEAGDPVHVGALCGVALDSASASTDIVSVAVHDVWALSVAAVTATANLAIAIGDLLYLDGADTAASGTLTSDATAPSDGDTVTIGSVVYTYRTALSAGPTVPYEVLIGVSAAVALDNLKSAIEGTAGEGTTYSTGTDAHPLATATTNTATTQVVEARSIGGAGGSIVTTESSSHLSWGATTLVDGSKIGELNGASGGTYFGVALGAVAAGTAATIPVMIKRTF